MIYTYQRSFQARHYGYMAVLISIAPLCYLLRLFLSRLVCRKGIYIIISTIATPLRINRVLPIAYVIVYPMAGSELCKLS